MKWGNLCIFRLTSSILFFISVNILFYIEVARAEYPERPVTIIVGLEAGGPVDIACRALVVGASKFLVQPIVVENKAGGGGTVALAVVATAKPDGYALCAVPNISIVDTPLMQRVPFKPLKSFTPIIAYAVGTHTALLVKSDSPWKTFNEFIDYAKKNPSKIKYSSAGVGTSVHVAMEVIARKEGIKWVHVPFKGARPAITALMGGHVDACSSGVDWPPHVQSGSLRVLATHGEKRSPHFSDIPTIKELGYNYMSFTIHSIVGPAGLPTEAVEKLETAFAKGRQTSEFRKAVDTLYLTPYYHNSKDYGRHLKEKWDESEKLFKEIGIIQEPATQPD